MEQLALSDFSDAVGEIYSVELDDARFELRLESAAEVHMPAPATGSFRLEFRGPFEPILPQATYSFRRGETAFEIFIVPIGREEAGTLYEAIFTRAPLA